MTWDWLADFGCGPANSEKQVEKPRPRRIIVS
jgi:hypothetical protein